MNRLHTLVLSVILTSVGLGIFAYKALVLSFPTSADATSSVWTVEAMITFTAANKPIKVKLNIPRGSRSTMIMDENFVSHGFGLTTTEKRLNRWAEWSRRKVSGKQYLFYRAVVRKLTPEEEPYALPPAKEGKPLFEGAYLTATEAIIEDIRTHSADPDSFVKNLLAEFSKRSPSENVRLLLGKNPDTFKKMVVAARVLSIAGISSRAAHGVMLIDQSRDVPLEHWLEVFDDNRWVVLTENGNEVDSANHLIWWRGEKSIMEISGVSHPSVNLSVSQNQEHAITSALARSAVYSPFFIDYSLFSLPIQSQAVYRVILMIPLGALLIVVLRNIVGLKTVGTFMPVLIAIAFRETQLLSGLILFLLIVGLGLAVRFYLEHLKLLMVPRLAAIVSVVVLMMAATSIITHKLEITPGLSVALFPMIIMAMAIERTSILWEEVGAFAALRQLASTLVSAAVIYLILTNRSIEHLIFVFPELLLVVIAVTILLGRYTGFRLLEIRRFKKLAAALEDQ